MFEVGFSEIVLLMLIALVVLGPEKLPKLAADVGRWVGRARAMARQLRTQLDQEVQLDDILRDKPGTPSYPPPNQSTASTYGAAGAAAGTASVEPASPAATSASTADGATSPTTAEGAATPTTVDGTASPTTADVTTPPTQPDTTDPVGAMQGAPTSREAAYAAYVAQTQAAYQNPPAVGPGAPDIGAPTDDAHSHGPDPAPPAAGPAPASPPTDPERAHGHGHS